MNYQSILQAVAADVAPMVGGGWVAGWPITSRRWRVCPAGSLAWRCAPSTASPPQPVTRARRFRSRACPRCWGSRWGCRRSVRRCGTAWAASPWGNPFNSLEQLEREEGKPRNPFNNAAALRVGDRLLSAHADPSRALADLGLALNGEAFAFDPEVERSERATGFRNAALANFIKSFGQIDNDVEAVLALYCRQCSIVSDCTRLARALGFLANGGQQPGTGVAVLSREQARRVNSLMLTCGTYDAAGEFAFKVGLPCKSGVGGAIVAVVPGLLVLCAWSPGLDETGNSVAARLALELFVARTGLSVF